VPLGPRYILNVSGYCGCSLRAPTLLFPCGRLSDLGGYARMVVQTPKLSVALSPVREWSTQASCPGAEQDGLRIRRIRRREEHLDSGAERA